jgi:hypothetical protein
VLSDSGLQLAIVTFDTREIDDDRRGQGAAHAAACNPARNAPASDALGAAVKIALLVGLQHRKPRRGYCA